MSYFTTRKLFLVPSFDLSEEETIILSKYFLFLENSGVGNIIDKYVLNNTRNGGRPNVNYYNLFAAILFGFSYGRDTLRDLEDACSYDLRYISIMEQLRPSYSTFSNFINKVIVPNEEIIFKLINKEILKEMHVDLVDVYVDGSKFEANANKYKFVWKPTTFHKRISITFFNILKENHLCENFRFEEMISSKTIALSIDELINRKNEFDNKRYESIFKSLNNILLKVIEYEEKELICGKSRKSYYKTDKDATAMCLKSDYYSGLGSNMHAGYNTQIAVSEGLVCAYYVSNSRTDINDFIPLMDKFYYFNDKYPINICADSGYGSLENYRYIKENNIGNYIKYMSWEGNVSGLRPDSYILNDDETITCLNGNIGYKVILEYRHVKKSGSCFYKVDGCTNCLFKDYCMRFIKNHEFNDFKIFEINTELIKYKQESELNLLSKKGIEIRVNRSVQVEGVFGIEKQDRKYTRVRRRGINNVSTEMMLVYLGMNVKKLLNYYKTNKKNKFWNAPNNLEPQIFKKPSYKKLSKKGKKINEKYYNE